MQEKGRYNARNCCVNSYITKRSSEAPHLTELRLVIQLCNPAPVETKKERQTNKTAGAGGAPLPQPAEAGVAEGWSPRAQPPRGAGNGRSPCGDVGGGEGGGSVGALWDMGGGSAVSREEAQVTV